MNFPNFAENVSIAIFTYFGITSLQNEVMFFEKGWACTRPFFLDFFMVSSSGYSDYRSF